MSITITISVDAPEDLQAHLRVLLASTVGGKLVVEDDEGGIVEEVTGDIDRATNPMWQNRNFGLGNILPKLHSDGTIEGEVVPARERGKPAPGKARRTKAEIEEDEAADAAGATTSVVSETSTDSVQQISTGENRVGPEDAQDAADEKAEADAKRDGLTHDDLRGAVAKYQKKYGMTACVADIPQIIGCAIAEVADADIASALEAIEQGVELNPFGRAVVGAEKAADKPVEKQAKAATIDDVKTAMLAYALKYDGQNTDMNNMPVTMEDCPQIFKLLFGPECVKLSQVPATAEAYGKVVSGINEAIAKDPFKRGAK
jgi:hypothetical protein